MVIKRMSKSCNLLIIFFFRDLEIQMQMPEIADIKYIEGGCDCTLKMHQEPRGPAWDLMGHQGAPLWWIPALQFSKP